MKCLQNQTLYGGTQPPKALSNSSATAMHKWSLLGPATT
jgi:hypothetical protein